MSKTYVDIVERSTTPPPDIAINIPRGFIEGELDEQALRQRRIRQEFDEIVLEVELRASDLSNRGR